MDKKQNFDDTKISEYEYHHAKSLILINNIDNENFFDKYMAIQEKVSNIRKE